MNYAEYIELTEATEIDQKTYRALLKDAAGPHTFRLQAILNTLIRLNVPENYDGDVNEIKTEVFAEIARADCADDMLEYAKMIWLLPSSVSEALFHTIEQLLD